ncbi:MAG: hypothetical protein LUD02_13685 [Tannerellaceae bacterium]|nr:hypothetical protein [Tannerellaceae bacterium]
MYKIFFITFVAISVVFSSEVYSQETKPQRHFDREAYQAKKNAFIIAEVGLTPDEAAMFIPLTEELQQKMFEVGRECRKLTREVRTNKSLTEADYTKVNDECIDVRWKEAQLEKEYYRKFKEIISSEKLYKYRRAEAKFAKDFMRNNGR